MNITIPRIMKKIPVPRKNRQVQVKIEEQGPVQGAYLD
jgi:hypothetical protein